MESVKGRNPSIDVFHYVCAILVIAIHTGPFEELNTTIGYIATDTIPRISVPFFFIVSGIYIADRTGHWARCSKYGAVSINNCDHIRCRTIDMQNEQTDT